MDSGDVLERLAQVAAEAREQRQRSAPSDTSTIEGARQKIAELERAMARRTVLGQATGIVMERYGLDAAAAHGVLARLAEERRVAVHDVARELVDAGPATEARERDDRPR